MPKTFLITKITLFAVILFTVLFLLPILNTNLFNLSFFELFGNKSNGFSSSIFRTVLFSILSTFFCVIGGLILALRLSKISLESQLGKQLSFFIFPAILGNTSIAFVFKVIFFNTASFDAIVQNGSLYQNGFLLALQFWQYGFLFAYLFWLSIKNTPQKTLDYAFSIGLSKFEKFKDVILPQVKNLFILLLFIGFVFSFYEDIKSQFLFKASQGNNTELINHWVYRNFQSNLLINPIYANQSSFTFSVYIFLIVLVIFILLGTFTILAIRLFNKIKSNGKPANSNIQTKSTSSKIFSGLCLTTILLPIAIALLKSKFNIVSNLSLLILPLALTLIASIFSTVLAIAFGVASRLIFNILLREFNSKSLFYFLLIFIIQLLPPLAIMLCGFKWLSWFGVYDNIAIYIVWILGHCFLSLPVLGSFVVATHFAVKENELNYLFAQKSTLKDIVSVSFLRRFKGSYLFTFLFAFAFIWNDAGLNIVLSDKIPSFAANLQMLFIGRAADYSKATSFLVVAIVLSLASVFVWQNIMSRTVNNTKN